jgi:hypothetical protein
MVSRKCEIKKWRSEKGTNEKIRGVKDGEGEEEEIIRR